MTFSSLAYITLIRFSFCISTDKRKSFRQREKENFRKKKKKKKKITKLVRNDFEVKQMTKNDKKKQDKRYIITILMRNNVQNGSPTIDAVDAFGHIFASKWQLKISSCFFYFSLSFT